MAGAQVEVAINQIEKQRLGYQAISLTNFDNDSEPQIASGSKVEIGGALFEFTSLESITGWGAIGNNNDVYKKLVVSGTSVMAEFTTAAPTWSTSKQGWYVSLDRYIGGCYKDASGNYTKKYLWGRWYENNLNIKIRADGGIELVNADVAIGSGKITATGGLKTDNTFEKTKTFSTGWNMDTTHVAQIAHGLTLANIRRISVAIKSNSDVITNFLGTLYSPVGVSLGDGGSFAIGTTYINLYRKVSGYYDAADFNAATAYVEIVYV